MATFAPSRKDARKEKASKKDTKKAEEVAVSPINEVQQDSSTIAEDEESSYNAFQFEGDQEKQDYREILLRLAKEMNCKLKAKPSSTQSLDDEWFVCLIKQAEQNNARRGGGGSNNNDQVSALMVEQLVAQALKYKRGLSVNRMSLILALLAGSENNEEKMVNARVLEFALSTLQSLPASDKLTKRNIFLLLSNLTFGPNSRTKPQVSKKSTMSTILNAINVKDLLSPYEAPANLSVDTDRERGMIEAIQVNIINFLANVLSGDQYEATGNMLMAASPKTTATTAPAAPGVSSICQFFANCLQSDSDFVKYRSVAFLTLFTRVEKARTELNKVQLLQQVINMAFDQPSTKNDASSSSSSSSTSSSSKAVVAKNKVAAAAAAANKKKGGAAGQPDFKEVVAEYAYVCIAHMCMDETNAAYVATERKDVLTQLAAVIKGSNSSKVRGRPLELRFAAYNAVSCILHGAQENTVSDVVVGGGLADTLLADLKKPEMRHPAIITLNSIATNVQEGVVEVFTPLLEGKVLDTLSELSMGGENHIIGSAVAAIRSIVLKVTEANDETIKKLVTEAVQRNEHLKQILMYLEEYEKSKGAPKPAPVKQILLSVAALVIFLVLVPHIYRFLRMFTG